MQKFLLFLASATTCLGMAATPTDGLSWKSAGIGNSASGTSINVDRHGKASYRKNPVSGTFDRERTNIAAKTPSRVSEADLFNIKTILDEDFKSLTNGNMENPTAVNITEPDGMIKGLPGWHGEEVYDAGGCLYVNMSVVEDPEWGFLTPVGEIFTPDLATDGAPTVRIRFRVKGVPTDEDMFDSLNIIVLGLSDMIPDDQKLIDFPYVNLTDEWQDVSVEVELPEEIALWSDEADDDVDCPLTGIRIKLQPRETPFYLDDVIVETLTPKVAVPQNLSYTEFSDSGFTAEWDAVEGADSYTVYAFDAEFDAEQYAFNLTLNKEYETSTNSVNVEMDTKGVIYFSVVAHKDGMISPASEPVMVFSVTAPEMHDATDISDTGFNIGWTPANGADGTEIWAYRMNTLNGDAADYPYLKLDFANTSDNPASSQVLFLDEYAYGWAAMPYPSFYDGAIVLDNNSAWMTGQDAKLMSTGAYDLSSITGKVKVYVTACTYDYSGLVVASGGYDEKTESIVTMDACEIPELTEDWKEYTFEVEAKNPQTMFIIQALNLGVLAIRDVRIEASFPSGAVIGYPYFTQFSEDDSMSIAMPSEECERVKYIGRSVKDLIVSIDGQDQLLNEAISNYSSPKYVDVMTGIESVETSSATSVFYTIDGIYAGDKCPSQKGIYIKRCGNSTSKIIVK